MSLQAWQRRYVLWGAIPPLAVLAVPTALLALAWLVRPLPAASDDLGELGTGAALLGFFAGIYAYPAFLLVGTLVAAFRRGGKGALMFLLGAVAIAGALGVLLFSTCAFLLVRVGGGFP